MIRVSFLHVVVNPMTLAIPRLMVSTSQPRWIGDYGTKFAVRHVASSMTR
jgi:hypothetical protein